MQSSIAVCHIFYAVRKDKQACGDKIINKRANNPLATGIKESEH